MKKKMKVSVLVMLCVMSLVGLFGCGKQQDPSLKAKQRIDDARDAVDDVKQQNQQMEGVQGAMDE